MRSVIKVAIGMSTDAIALADVCIALIDVCIALADVGSHPTHAGHGLAWQVTHGTGLRRPNLVWLDLSNRLPVPHSGGSKNRCGLASGTPSGGSQNPTWPPQKLVQKVPKVLPGPPKVLPGPPKPLADPHFLAFSVIFHRLPSPKTPPKLAKKGSK